MMREHWALLALGLTMIAWGSCGCASDPCDARHPDTFALLAECKLRVERECPTLKRGECMLGAVVSDPKFWGAVMREAVVIAADVGKATLLEVMRTIRHSPNKKELLERIVKMELLQRSYRP
jgi:hypothetical protein